MAGQPIDYEEVLADLDRRLTDLDAQRAELEEARSIVEKILAATSTERERIAEPQENKVKERLSYADLSVPEAARHYLTKIGKPQTTRQLSDALRNGGYHSDSSNFTATVYGSLARHPDFSRTRGRRWRLVKGAEAIEEGESGRGCQL